MHISPLVTIALALGVHSLPTEPIHPRLQQRAQAVTQQEEVVRIRCIVMYALLLICNGKAFVRVMEAALIKYLHTPVGNLGAEPALAPKKGSSRSPSQRQEKPTPDIPVCIPLIRSFPSLLTFN